MKRLLMAILAVAVAISFSAPSFAGEEGKKEKKGKKDGQVLIYGDEDKDKKEEKGGQVSTFGEEKGKKKGKDEKGN